jgi:hypothetical protein
MSEEGWRKEPGERGEGARGSERGGRGLERGTDV